MAADLIPDLIRKSITRDQMIDLASLLRACRSDAAKAMEVTPLAGKAKARAVGYVSHEITEQRLAELIRLHEGHVVEGGNFPGTELRNYQVLGVYGRVIVGKASIIEAGTLPTRNMTRGNGAKLNKSFSKQPDIPGVIAPTPDDGFLYVTLLTCRDRHDIGSFHEVAVSVIEAGFLGFAFYQEVDAFLSGYRDDSAETGKSTAPAPIAPQPMGIELRKDAKPFIGGEVGMSQNDSGGSKTA